MNFHNCRTFDPDYVSAIGGICTVALLYNQRKYGIILA